MTESILKPRGKDAGGFGNEILYRMCEEQPKHKSIEIIFNKLWIIGRSYSASIERTPNNKRAGKKEGWNFIRDEVAHQILEEPIDVWIEEVSSIQKLDKETLVKSLECHKKVTNLFGEITGKEMRSLASKYLHFHAPQAFFIYDSIASRQIKLRVKDQKDNLKKFEDFKKNEKYDAEYARFCVRCLCYLESQGKNFTPRQLDMELLKYEF